MGWFGLVPWLTTLEGRIAAIHYDRPDISQNSVRGWFIQRVWPALKLSQSQDLAYSIIEDAVAKIEVAFPSTGWTSDEEDFIVVTMMDEMVAAWTQYKSTGVDIYAGQVGPSAGKIAFTVIGLGVAAWVAYKVWEAW